MDHDFSKYPDGSMLAEFIMDVYANMDTNEITILYDEEFGVELLHVDYNSTTKTLDFVFSGIGSVPFGVPLKENLCPYFEKNDNVTLLHMDTNSNLAISGVTVPLKVI